jgi:hypothetical protein
MEYTMTNLSDYFDQGNFYDTSDADVVSSDITVGVIAYGAAGRIVGAIPFSAVELLLHMNGVDASTTFIDDSESAHTVSTFNDTQLQTADKKFGSASAIFDGTADYFSVPYVVGFDWFNGDYTIECWVKASAWTDWENPAAQPNMIGRMNINSASNYWSFGPIANGKLVFYYFSGSSQYVQSTATVPTGQWVHIAMTYVSSSGAIKLFIDGVLDGEETSTGTLQSATYDLIVGRGNGVDLTGAIDDLRITNSYSRYAEDFTPPTEQFPDS